MLSTKSIVRYVNVLTIDLRDRISDFVFHLCPSNVLFVMNLDKDYDGAIGDLTFTANRSSYVDFTLPYTDVGVGMIAAKDSKNMWIFLRPLTIDLWLSTAAFFVLTGLIVWLIERPINAEFQGSVSQQIGIIFWFSFSTLVFAHSKLSS